MCREKVLLLRALARYTLIASFSSLYSHKNTKVHIFPRGIQIQREPARPGPARPDPARPGPTRPDPARPDRYANQLLIAAECVGVKSSDLHENLGIFNQFYVLAAGSRRTGDFVAIDELPNKISVFFRNFRFLSLFDTLYLGSILTD